VSLWSTASIRVRLTAQYTIVLALMLVVYATATYVAVRHEFLEQLEEEASHGVDTSARIVEVDAQLREILIVLAGGLPLVVLLAGAGGYILARRALAPIEHLASEARRITADRLHERLSVPNAHDEIGRLAAVINEAFGRIESSFDQLRRFTADASHELRTPLSVIRGVGEVGLSGTRAAAEYKETIGSMLEEVDRLTRLVDTLLRLSRGDAGVVALAKERFDVTELVREVASSLGILAEERRQRLTVEDAGAVSIAADRLVVREAIANVVDNAIKYSPERSTIAIRVRGEDGRAVIDVADEGQGIAPEHRARIFDRFFRVDEGRSRDHGGTGLGLAIAKWAVDVNGGSISVEAGPGGGSVFRIVLPIALAMCVLLLPHDAVAQDASPRTIRAGVLSGDVAIDGMLDEEAWKSADVATDFLQTDPVEGAQPSAPTRVRVLAAPKAIVVGIECDDGDPAGIVSFSKARDAVLASEDHVRLVFGPFLDGRSGYVFAINPGGARYDALVEPGGEDENANWDGIWEAAARRTARGWTVEIRIPIDTLAFNPGAREWHFNVERRIQRRLETDRWASAERQFKVTQTSRAGRLIGLPDFALGAGLAIRPSVTTGGGMPAPGARVSGEFQPSLDVTQRIGANVLSSLTVNTDFAETEVDTRRTNLTRFPLFFPEKRTFFLEGADIFSFGLGLGEDVVPYFSRRIGLVDESEVLLRVGGKINGRIGQANVGGLVVETGGTAGVVDRDAFMAVGRVKQNLWRESWVGAIATVGDPLGRSGSWLAGGDFTYATSRFRGDKNFLVGVWGLAMDRVGAGSDRTAYGAKIDYPNDLWDMFVTYKRIGRDFDPSIGFVPRQGVVLYSGGVNNHARITNGVFQQLTHEFEPTLATDLGGRWESYRVFMAPVNWRFRSGDRFEFNVVPVGERLVEPFAITETVSIDPGSYHWRRYRLEAGTARKRRFYTQATWWFGDFYDGTLDQYQWIGAWNPTPLLTLEFSGERDVGRLRAGDFVETVAGTRARFNLSPDLNISSYVQYDTTDDSIGVNTRLRWTFKPVADLFVVYNHNVRDHFDRWQLESNQLLVKVQYAFRY
jgi:signal transduction histidine kinase